MRALPRMERHPNLIPGLNCWIRRMLMKRLLLVTEELPLPLVVIPTLDLPPLLLEAGISENITELFQSAGN